MGWAFYVSCSLPVPLRTHPFAPPPTRRPSYKPSTFPSSPVQASLPLLIIFNPPCALPLILKPIIPPSHTSPFNSIMLGCCSLHISGVVAENVKLVRLASHTFQIFSSYVRTCQPPGWNFSTCPILCKQMQALGGKHPGAKYK